MEADEVAQIGITAVKKQRAISVPGALNQITVWFTKMLPRWAVRRMARGTVERML